MQKIKMENKKERTIKEGYTEFQKYCQVRNYSNYTIKHYDNTIHSLELFYSLDNDISTITEELVNDYIMFLLDKNLAGRTLATYIGSLRTIIYYFIKKDYIVAFKIMKPKFDQPIKEVYTDVELALLLKKPNVEKCGFTEYRNWVIVNYLLSTGQRRNTVINLKIADYDPENGMMALRIVKNRKPTILPLSQTIVEILNHYLKFRKGSEEDFLFCNAMGGQMAGSCLGCAIKKYNRSRGVSETSIHAFRHTFAKKYLLAGGNVFVLQKLMMHSDLNTTKQYLNLYLDDLRQDYDKFNPLDQMVKYGTKIKMD